MVNDTGNVPSGTIWELGSRVKNPSEFAVAIIDSDLRDFGFSENCNVTLMA